MTRFRSQTRVSTTSSERRPAPFPLPCSAPCPLLAPGPWPLPFWGPFSSPRRRGVILEVCRAARVKDRPGPCFHAADWASNVDSVVPHGVLFPIFRDCSTCSCHPCCPPFLSLRPPFKCIFTFWPVFLNVGLPRRCAKGTTTAARFILGLTFELVHFCRFPPVAMPP